MVRWTTWLLGSLLLLLLLVGLNSLLFTYANSTPLSPVESLLFVMESLTTTGFGSQALTSPATQLWAVLLMCLGLVLIAGLLTTLIQQMSRPLIEHLPPRRAAKGLHDHVLIVGAGPVGRYVASACQEACVPSLLLDQESQRLRKAVLEGFRAMDGEPRRPKTLEAARLAQARALVLTERDGTNLTVLMQARAIKPELPCYSTQEALPPALFKRAGATELVSVERRLGRRLGKLALSPYEAHCHELAKHVEGLIGATLPVLPGALPGLEAALRDSEALLLGAVTRGLFVPLGRQPLRPGDLAVLVGRPAAILRLRQRCELRPLPPMIGSGPVLILGAGHVGRAAAAFLRAQGVQVWLIDRRPIPQDCPVERFTQGDATEGADLRRAGAAEAAACIIGLDSDEAALIAAMALRGLNPNCVLLCRATSAESVPALYLAGAEAVATLPEVGGAALARLAVPSGCHLPGLDDLVVREVALPPTWVGRSLGELELGGLLCVAVRAPDGAVQLAPEVGAPLVAGSQLLLFGEREGFAGLPQA